MRLFHFYKRAFDVVIALIAGVLFAPIILVVTILLWFSQRRVFFRQRRPGFRGSPFSLYKFCTMTDERDANGVLLTDNQRLTRAGALVRSASLDELPQLWNVLKGEMSLVGPRPLLMQYLDRYTPEQARRHEVLPGITGWAQVNGRNAITWEEKFKLDVWYVENWSLRLDAKILCMTLVKVLKREGISHGGYATMAEYKGPGRS